MKFEKIIISILFVLVFVIAMSVMPIFASASSAGTVTFGCTTFDACPGEEFTTTICVKENSNLTGFDITLNYSDDFVSLVKYKVRDASEVNIIGTQIEIHFAQAENITDRLNLIDLTFRVDAELSANSYSEWLTWTGNEDDNAFTTLGVSGGRPQYADLDITFDFEPLFIRQMGDAYNNNNDGKVNARDASYILQHAAHMFTMPEIDQNYANVYFADDAADGTPRISARDASLILQYAAHMKGVVLDSRYNVTCHGLNENGE